MTTSRQCCKYATINFDDFIYTAQNEKYYKAYIDRLITQ